LGGSRSSSPESEFWKAFQQEGFFAWPVPHATGREDVLSVNLVQSVLAIIGLIGLVLLGLLVVQELPLARGGKR
jgi:hypothetical protein